MIRNSLVLQTKSKLRIFPKENRFTYEKGLSHFGKKIKKYFQVDRKEHCI